MNCQHWNYKRDSRCPHNARVHVLGDDINMNVCVGHALAIYRWLVMRDKANVVLSGIGK